MIRGDEDRTELVGGRRVHDAPIHLAEPDPEWPERYRRAAGRISAHLGERALAVEHVGSTSVPGLAAKPIIDIVLVVADPADEGAYRAALEDAGFALRIREPDWYEHRTFRGPDVNLHVFGDGCPEVRRMIRFRDLLRRDDRARARYADVKRELARRRWRYVQDYADAKSEVIGQLLAETDAPQSEPPDVPGTCRHGGV